jgi:hypothetical protein
MKPSVKLGREFDHLLYWVDRSGIDGSGTGNESNGDYAFGSIRFQAVSELG